MTLNQLQTLSEDETVMALHIINVIAPPGLPKMTFEPRHLTWFKHDLLIKKFIDAFPSIKPEGHATYISLMQKLGVCIQINQNPPPNEPRTNTPIPTTEETTGSIGCPPSQSLSPDVQAVTGSNEQGEPTRSLEI